MVDTKKQASFSYKCVGVQVDLDKHFSRSWQLALKPLFSTVYFNVLMIYINRVYTGEIRDYLPLNQDNVFEPFKTSNPDDIKVVIMGAGPGFAKPNGLLFGSDTAGANDISPLLKQHEKHLCKGLNERHYFDGSLRDWADQGVLLLNARPILHKNVPAHFAHIFDYFMLNVLSYLSSINEDLIIAGATLTAHALMDKIEGDDALRVKTLGFITDNNSDDLLYDQINKKLGSIHEEKIEWVSRV